MKDQIDLDILKALQEDGRISNAEISRRLGLAPSAVLERIRRMERTGVIERFEVRLSPRKLGLDLTVLIELDTDESPSEHKIAGQLAEIPEIQEIHEVAGTRDYFLKVRVSGTDELASVLDRIGSIPHVLNSRTTLVLRTFKETASLPLNDQK